VRLGRGSHRLAAEPRRVTAESIEASAGVWAGAVDIVGPGTGHNMAAALGLGLKPGDLALSLGSAHRAKRQ
jgi:xylulokinase